MIFKKSKKSIKKIKDMIWSQKVNKIKLIKIMMITKLVKVNRNISKRKSREVKILFKSNLRFKALYFAS